MSPVAKFWNGTAWQSLNGLPVYEQPAQPSEPVPQGSVWIDTDAPTPAVYPKLLAVQRDWGIGLAYYNSHGGAGDVIVTTNGASNNLDLSYTPPVDAWWELSCMVGLIQKNDANWHYIQLIGRMSQGAIPAVSGLHPAVAPVNPFSISTASAHNALPFVSLQTKVLVPLTAGVAYTAYWSLMTNGGNWSYYQGYEYLFAEGKAWSR